MLRAKYKRAAMLGMVTLLSVWFGPAIAGEADVTAGPAQAGVIAAEDLLRNDFDADGDALTVIGLPALLGVAGSSLTLSLRGRDGDGPQFEIGNPLSLRSTVAFASVLAIVLVGVSIASRSFGSTGTLITSAIGGSTDVHAATLALSNLVASGDLAAADAMLAILRDIALGRDDGLLDGVTLLVIPIYNVDGHERESPGPLRSIEEAPCSTSSKKSSAPPTNAR